MGGERMMCCGEMMKITTCFRGWRHGKCKVCGWSGEV
jgi:hypothetical protein